MRWMKREKALSICFVALLAIASSASGDPPAQLTSLSRSAHSAASLTLGSAPPVVSSGKAKLVRALDPSLPIRITLALQGPRDDELEKAALAIVDRNSANYRHFLSFDEIKQRYQPSDADVASVERWAQSVGLIEVRRSKTNRALAFDTKVGRVNKLFGVAMGRYTEGARSFFSNDRDAQLPAGAPEKIWAVLGLESYTRPVGSSAPDRLEPRVSSGESVFELPPAQTDQVANGQRSEKATPAISPGGSDFPPYQSYEPADIAGASAYNLDPLLRLSDCCNPTRNRNGPSRETSLAILNLNTADPNDYDHFFAHYNNPEGTHVHVVQIDGPTCCDGETTLDIEWSGALLGLNGAGTEIYDYVGGGLSFDELLTTLDHAFGDDRARVLSISYGYSERFLATSTGSPSRAVALFHQTLLAMALGGWTVIVSAGDDGAYEDCANAGSLGVEYPGSDPVVVSVGGTVLALKPPAGIYVSETTWSGNGCKNPGGNGGGGGSGCSIFYGALPWQKGINGSCGNDMRSVPDIAFNSAGRPTPGVNGIEYGQAFYVNGQWGTSFGTSEAAPELAAFFVYENSYLLKLGIGSIGLNALPALYSASTLAPHNPYYDITTGSTGGGYGPGWAATPGYDLATGWGSANMFQLAWAMNHEVLFGLDPLEVHITAPVNTTKPHVNFHITGGSGGVAGYTARWDSDPGDPKALAHPCDTPQGQCAPGYPFCCNTANSFYGGPGKLADHGTLELKIAGEGCHTAYVRAWDNTGISVLGTFGPLCDCGSEDVCNNQCCPSSAPVCTPLDVCIGSGRRERCHPVGEQCCSTLGACPGATACCDPGACGSDEITGATECCPTTQACNGQCCSGDRVCGGNPLASAQECCDPTNLCSTPTDGPPVPGECCDSPDQCQQAADGSRHCCTQPLCGDECCGASEICFLEPNGLSSCVPVPAGGAP